MHSCFSVKQIISNALLCRNFLEHLVAGHALGFALEDDNDSSKNEGKRTMRASDHRVIGPFVEQLADKMSLRRSAAVRNSARRLDRLELDVADLQTQRAFRDAEKTLGAVGQRNLQLAQIILWRSDAMLF